MNWTLARFKTECRRVRLHHEYVKSALECITKIDEVTVYGIAEISVFLVHASGHCGGGMHLQTSYLVIELADCDPRTTRIDPSP